MNSNFGEPKKSSSRLFGEGSMKVLGWSSIPLLIVAAAVFQALDSMWMLNPSGLLTVVLTCCGPLVVLFILVLSSTLYNISDCPAKGDEKLLELVKDFGGTEACHNSALIASANAKDSQKVEEMVSKMEQSGFSPSFSACMAMIDMALELEDPQQAEKWLLQVPQPEINVLACTIKCIVDHYIRAEQFQHAESLITRMSEKGLFPYAKSYNAIIEHYAKQGKSACATNFLRSMERAGFEVTNPPAKPMLKRHWKGIKNRSLNQREEELMPISAGSMLIRPQKGSSVSPPPGLEDVMLETSRDDYLSMPASTLLDTAASSDEEEI